MALACCLFQLSQRQIRCSRKSILHYDIIVVVRRFLRPFHDYFSFNYVFNYRTSGTKRFILIHATFISRRDYLPRTEHCSSITGKKSLSSTRSLIASAMTRVEGSLGILERLSFPNTATEAYIPYSLDTLIYAPGKHAFKFHHTQ